MKHYYNQPLLALLFSVFCLPIFSQTTIFDYGSSWSYYDLQNEPSDQGSIDWNDLTYDDSSWATGNSHLGYGDGDEVTVINPNTYTVYVRHSFNVSDPSNYSSLNLNLTYDDGAVVYLNGTEVWRVNLPTGTIAYDTFTPTTASDNSSISTTIADALQSGANVLSVEVHQRSATSSDISFDFKLSANAEGEVNVNRGPYLQKGTPNSVVVKWRTLVPTESVIKYGTSLGNLDLTISDNTPKIEHELEVTGLEASTTYYYEIANSSTVLVPGASDLSFKTHPISGSAQTYTFWALGDPGTANNNQRAVRDAYYNYIGSNSTDGIIFLGDNAYNDGTDAEYQTAMFENMYEEKLKNTLAWSCLGNHDGHSADSGSQTGPYYDIFTFPTNGESGGMPSGTEAYYSWDYGNIHFIALDSYDSNRSVGGSMYNWALSDIQNTTQEWIIAYWHHPPYTKGSHDSDTESQLIDMRQNFLPMLENNGVDLILSGHSHSYERSYFLNGHYGISDSFNSDSNTVGANGNGNGRTDGTGAYTKETSGPNAGKGAVYITAGSSGKISSASLDHEAMYYSVAQLGSCIVEVNGSALTVKFVRETGAIEDYFTIEKDGGCIAPTDTASGDIETYVGNLIDNAPGSSGDNYVEPNGTELNTWNTVLDDLLVDNIANARSNACSLNYKVTEFSDTSLSPNQIFYVLEEKSPQQNYWGTYVFSKTPERENLVLMAPHSKYDTNTGKEAVHCFKNNVARAVFLNGTHRCNSNNFSGCSGTTSVCGSSESYRVSDLAHNTASMFQESTKNLLNNISNSVFIQLHGFAKQASDPYVIMSNGTRITPSPDYATLIQNALLVEDNTLTFELAHINTSWTRLIGFTNTQGRLINNSADHCTSSATSTTGRFVHIEQEKSKLRDDITGWTKMSNALGNAFPANCTVDSDSDGVCDIDDICPGFDDNIDTDDDGIPDGCDTCDSNLVGTQCDDGDNCTTNDIYDDNCGCAGTFEDLDSDGVCDADDQCPGQDDALIGAVCDDGDACTINDVYDTNCGCVGTFADSDADGVCDSEDICPGFDDTIDSDGDTIPDGCDSCDNSLNGSPCDDGDSCTTNDVYDANCGCVGTFTDSDGDGVCDSDDECPGFDDNIDSNNNGIPDGCESTCIEFTTNFNNNPLIHSGSGSGNTLLTLPLDSQNVLFTINGINQKTNGKPSNKYIEQVNVSYIDVNGVSQDYGTYSGANTSTVNVDIQGVVQSITISLADIFDGDTGGNMNINFSDVSYCIDSTPCTTDSDGDGICDSEDQCPGKDDSLIGTSCDDGDNCTTGEIFDDNCNCSGGIYSDNDGDGLCVGDDPDDSDGCNPDPNSGACSPCGDIVNDSFESGFGNWNDGGNDVARNASNANTGVYSIRLRDNSGNSSSMFSNTLDLTSYPEVLFEFSYITNSMENGEDFFLEVSSNGGSSYTNLQTWISGTHFSNNTRYDETLTISGPFTNNTVFRIRCDASANNDQLYIDDILLTNCKTQQLARTSLSVDKSEVLENIIKVYPNPVKRTLFIDSNNVELKELDIYNLNGQLVRQINLDKQYDNTYKINLDGLSDGLYLMRMMNQDSQLIKTERIIIKSN